MEDPAHLDEPCTIEGAVGSGIDDCDVGLYCYDADKEGHGKCFAYCQSIEMTPSCPEDMECRLTNNSILDLCIRPCDPLTQDCPVESDACTAPNAFEPGGPESFYCWAPKLDDLHDGKLNSPCDFTTQCDKGLLCQHGSSAMECSKIGSCCQPICDTTAPNTCPGEAQECVPWFPEDAAPPGQGNVGICAVPL